MSHLWDMYQGVAAALGTIAILFWVQGHIYQMCRKIRSGKAPE